MSIDDKSSYYDAGGIEVIEVAKAKLSKEQLKGAYLFCIIKYSLRFNFKGQPNRDAEKVQVYTNLLNELLREENKITEEEARERIQQDLHEMNKAVQEHQRRSHLAYHNDIIKFVNECKGVKDEPD